MNKIFNYIPFHFLLALVLGICIQYFTNVWQYGFQKLAIIFIVFLIVIFTLNKSTQKIKFTLFSWLLFVFIGMSSLYIKDKRNYKDYYETNINKHSIALITIEKVLKPSNYYSKYEAKVIQVHKKKTCGKILLNIKKDSLQKQLQVDEQLLITTNFVEVNSQLNPHQFSYKAYLAKQGIHQQIFLKNTTFKIIGKRKFSLTGLASNFRTNVQNALQKYNFSSNEFGVINALLLGQRQEISKKLLQEYSRAGAIHILAVSGLHVGIILLLLSRLLKPIERVKKGVYFKAVLIVIALWVFAFIAGLSASVVRAVTMFTFVAVGQLLNRKNSVEYSLITSMFVLLFVKPMFLFDVGFQLSYLAVFGIIWVQPKLYSLWKPKFKIIDKAWQLFTVSIGAQAGILPISLYYFHQFPSLFIVSNLVIVPFLGIILMGGIVVITLALLNLLPKFLADFYGCIISKMNQFIGWISNQEDFVFQQLSMSFLLMIAWYLIIILGFRFVFIRKKLKQLIYLLIAIVGLQSVYLLEKYQTQTKKEFIVFHKSKESILGNRSGENLDLFTDIDSVKIKEQNLLNSYLVEERVSKLTKREKTNVFQFQNQQILVIDSLGVYKLNGLEKPIVLLQHSPKINIKRLISKLHPKKIIADGTNYKSYISRWKITCKKEKTPFHHTGKNGAFILSK